MLKGRALGLSTSTAFIWLVVIAAMASSLAIFWLLATISGNSELAAVGTLVTLCLGTSVGSYCCWEPNAFTQIFPFLRRYQPSLVFPGIFVFCVFVWNALTLENVRGRLIYSFAAGAVLSLLVFSYFYMWTAAVAWFGLIVLLWLLFRREHFRRLALTTVVVATFAVAALIPYLMMLARRNNSMDQSHIRILTRAPDLLNQPELIGFVVLAIIGYAASRNLIDVRRPIILFTSSFALVPFVLFNQQILSGESLQPIHYKAFIANYLSLISLVLIVWNLWRARYLGRAIPKWAFALIAIAVLSWGMAEVSRFTKRELPKALLFDDIRAVADRLDALAKQDGSVQAARAGKAPFPVVFTSGLGLTLEASMSIPTESPVAVLWSLHSHSVSMSLAESKERFYRHLYYSGIDPTEVQYGLKKEEFWLQAPLFGPARVISELSLHSQPITEAEIAEERDRYEEFYKNFGRQQAMNPMLTFVVVTNSDVQTNLGNLDKWYERDQGQRVRSFTIYRVKLRP
jgi:hypothetical protein